MKLNLLPARASKAKGEGGGPILGIIAGLVLAVGGLGYMFYITGFSENEINAQQARIDAAKPTYDEAVKVSARVDETIAKARGLVLNANLAESMLAHSAKYPALYDKIAPYLPPYFRYTDLSATPGGPGVTTVNIQGVIDNVQQYADLMASLARVPGVVSVSRTGFTDDPLMVPGLVEIDQTGRPRTANGGVVPDDPRDRLDFMISQAQNTDYVGTGGFGDLNGANTARGAGPNSSPVSIVLVMAGDDMTTPDPRSTLATAASLWPATTPATTPATQPAQTPPAGQGQGGGN